MEPQEDRDYTELSTMALRLGFQQAADRSGNPKAGFYRYKDTHAEVDLTACACSEAAIVKTALDQFAERIDNAYHYGIERDLNS